MVVLAARADARLAECDGVGPVAWVLHDGKAGMASQALGLAEATGFRFVEKTLSIRRPWVWLPPRLWRSPLAAATEGRLPLRPPWPDLVIACGRNSAMPTLAIRRASRGRTIAAQIQDPRVGHDEFDLMFVAEHDSWRGPRVFLTTGAINRVTPERLAAERCLFPELEQLPRPILAVLIGGSNRAYRLTTARLAALLDGVAAAVRYAGGSAVVTPSRRTGSEGLALARQRLAGIPAAIWDGTGANPYFAYLDIADAMLVTSDSISMISEAAATGKPVHIFDLDSNRRGSGRKFDHFHATMAAAGITRPFAGRIESWTYEPLNDTARAGAVLRDFVLARFCGRAAAA